MSTEVEPGRGLDAFGIGSDRVRWNLNAAALYEEAIRRLNVPRSEPDHSERAPAYTTVFQRHKRTDAEKLPN